MNTDFIFPIIYIALIILAVCAGAWVGWKDGFNKGKEYLKTDFDFERINQTPNK